MSIWNFLGLKKIKQIEQQVTTLTNIQLSEKALLRGTQPRAEWKFNTAPDHLSKAIISLNKYVYPHHSIHEAVKIFNTNPAVKSIVSKLTKKFGNIPAFVYDKDGNELSEKAKALEKLIARPNDDEGADVFLAKAYQWYKVTGETFIWLNKGISREDSNKMSDDEIKLMPTLKMHVLESDSVNVIPGPELFSVAGYEYTYEGQVYVFKKSEVFHWKNASMQGVSGSKDGHLRGTSPLTAGIKVVEAHERAYDAFVNSLATLGARGILYNKPSDKIMDSQTYEDIMLIKETIERDINSQDKGGGVMFYPDGELVWQDISKSPVDLQILEGLEAAKKDLCLLFDYRYELLNTEKVNYANGPAAQRDFVSSSIMPDVKQYYDGLNLKLLPGFGLVNEAIIVPDETFLSEMKRDYQVLSDAISKTQNCLSINDMRELLGFERKDDPKYDEIWMKDGHTPMNMLDDSVFQQSVTEELLKQGLIPNTRIDKNK